MADKDAFGLGPLDKLVEEYTQSMDSAPGIGAPTQQAKPPQEPDTPDVDVRRPTAAPSRARGLLPPTDMVPMFESASRRYDVPVNVLMALAQQESSYDPRVRGDETQWGRAKGMMQYLDGTARMMGINPYDSEQSVDAAAKQLRERLDKGYSMEDAVREHFAGPDRRKWGPKTAQYGESVIGKARQIGAQMYGSGGQSAGGQSADGQDAAQPANPFLTQGNMSTRQDGPMSVPAGTDTRRLNLTAAAPEPAQQDKPGIFDQAMNDFSRGVSNVKNIAIGVGALGADLFGADETADGLLKTYVENSAKLAKENPAVIGTYKNVHSFGDAGRYAVEAVAENLPMMIPSLLSGGIGALAARKIAEKGVAEFVEKQVASGVARSIAEKQAATLASKRLLQGGAAGAATSSVGIETGNIYGDTFKDTGKKTPGLSLAFGVPAGMLDAIEPVYALSKVMGPAVKELAGSVIKRMGAEAGKQFLIEAGTEGLQSMLENAPKSLATGKPYWTADLLDDVVDSALKGGIAGGVIGGTSTGARGAYDAARGISQDAGSTTGTDGNVTIHMPNEGSGKTGPMGRALQAGNEAANARRVTVTAPDGSAMTGFLDSYQEDGQGGYTARVLGDDGMPRVFSSADGVTIAPFTVSNLPAVIEQPITVDSEGNAATSEQRQARESADFARSEANRQRREQLGVTPDIERAALLQQQRERLPASLEDGQAVSVTTKDGEVIEGKAQYYDRHENGARLELLDNKGQTHRFLEGEITDITAQEPSNADSNVAGVADERPASTESNGSIKGQVERTSQVFTGKVPLAGDGNQYGAAIGRLSEGTRRQLMIDPSGGYFWGDYGNAIDRDAGSILIGEHKDFDPAVFPKSSDAREAAKTTPFDKTQPAAKPEPTVDPVGSVQKGVADATGTADEQPALSGPKAVADMSLDELVEHRKYLSTQARTNTGWNKPLSRERKRVEDAIRKIDPAALDQFKTAAERKHPDQVEQQSPQVSPSDTASAVTPRESDITTTQGKPLVELFHPAFGERMWVRKDQWDAGEDRLAAFTRAGTRRTGASQTVPRAALRSSVEAQAQEAAPVSAVPDRSNSQPTVAKQNEATTPADGKQAAALERIASGRARFGDQAKAKAFISKNGLTDTHAVEQTGAKRFEVKVKGAAAAPKENGADFGTVFHGTARAFDSFDMKRSGQGGGYRHQGDAVYLTTDHKGYARFFAQAAAVKAANRDKTLTPEQSEAMADSGGVIMRATVDPKAKILDMRASDVDPQVADLFGKSVGDTDTAAKLAQRVRDLGYDGIAFTEQNAPEGWKLQKDATTIAVYDPKMVRFERDVAAPDAAVAQPKKPRATKGTAAQNRAKEIMGADVGDIVAPSDGVGHVNAGIPMEITEIGKNGTVYVRNPSTGGQTSLSPGELIGASRRGVTFEKRGGAIADKTAPTPAKQPVSVVKTPGATAIVIDPSAMSAPSVSLGNVATGTVLEAEDGTLYRIDGIDTKAKRIRATRNPDQISERTTLIDQDTFNRLVRETESVRRQAIEAATQTPSPDPIAPVESTVAPEPKASDDRFAKNKIFTADRVAAARARLKTKLSQLNSGIDPEVLMDGLTITGAYVEEGVRDFSTYAKAMADDFGDAIKPYLLSFWEGVRNYPGLKADGMTPADEARAAHAALITDGHRATKAVGEIVAKPAKRTRKTGAKADMTLTQDWGTDHIDGYGTDSSRETGSDTKDAFLKESRQYLNAVSAILTENGYTPHIDNKGRPARAVSVNESGVAGSGDITLTLAGPDGVGAYIHIGDTALRGVVPSTPSGVAIMFRAAQNGDRYGVKGANQWAPTDLSAADLAALVDAHIRKEVKHDSQAASRSAGSGVEGSSAQSVPANEEPGRSGDLFGQPDDRSAGVDLSGDGRSGQRVAAPAEVERPDARRAGNDDGAQDSRGSGAVAGAGSDAGRDSAGRVRADRTDEPVRADRRREATERQPRPVSAPRNYRIQPGEIAREGSWKTTAERNVDVVELVKRLEAEGRAATDEEKALMTRFTGWGASEIANGVFPDRNGQFKPGWEALGERLKAALTPEEYANARRSTQYAHYTSEGVIRSIYAGLDRLGFKGGQLVEPGMGIGLFNGLMPDAMAAKSTYTGIEFDNITGAIAKHLYPASNVIVGDFTRTSLPGNYFDAAIGNPPFSSTVISNDPEYKRQRFMLHDYFFAKTIDRVRPGGLLTFITSKGTMDKASDKARKYLAERANLIGAVRLPQTAFKGNAGTEVVTDVLFLQKHGAGVEDNGVSWLGLKDVMTNKGEPTPVNEYFADHPDMVLGEHSMTGSMYRANEYTVEPRAGEDIEQAFAKAVERLPQAIYRAERATDAERAVVADRDFNPSVRKEGGLYVDDDGTLRQVENGSGVPLAHRIGASRKEIALKPSDIKWLKGYVGVRDALKQAQYDQLNDGDWQSSLARLNEVYDAFVKEHGPVLSNKVIERENDDGTVSVSQRFKFKPLFEIDAEGALAYALEKADLDGKITKQPVFFERVLRKPAVPVIKTTQDAMFVSLNDLGRLDIDHVAKLAGQDRAEVIDALGTAIYEAPGAGWQTADEYLSGNVVRKLAEARSAADLNQKYKRNIDALLATQPRPLGPTDITVRLGANWVPSTDIESFASDALGEQIDVMYLPVTGDWTAVGRSSVAGSEWAAGDMSPSAILDAVLNSRQIKVTYTDADKKTHTDPVKTEAANHTAQKMKDAFSRWLWTEPARADRLTKYYNEHFNNIAPRQYDGSHLTLPGVSSRFSLYPHQKRAIWRVIQDGDTYLAHAVGSGKTIEMIASGMEQRRLGLISKPIYTVPNHMLAQFSREFLELYPAAHIMVADEQNFHTGNRRRFLAQAALNDPDAIVITHSAFSRLGMSDEYADAFIQRQIDEWKSALADADDRITKKQIERRIEQLERRMEGKQSKDKKDRVLTFEELGADYLFVDEMHEFRKLDFATNQGNIKGIDPTGSQRALDLYMKVEYLRGKKPGRSITGASGTPITNTMGELFTVQRFFQPEQLAEDGLDTFDAWAAQYGDTVTGLEQNAAGGYEAVTRFAKFQNVPELMRRVRSFMDIVTNSKLGELVKRPNISGGARQIVVTPSPTGYKAYQKTLEARIKAIRARTGPPEKGDDIILNVIADGRFSAIDMRFVDPSMDADPDSKLNQVVDDIIADYRASAAAEYSTDGKPDEHKGASLIVFSDIGFGDQAAARRGFSMRKWMEHRFSDAGIPADHVAFIRDHKQHAKKERLFADMRAGRKRILIGGKDMETGVNVQKRLKYLYHIDAPWFPSSVEQREGRGVRQGNQNSEIALRAYATKGSYDSTMWGMNARKARFIEQAMNGDDSVRSLEDVSEASSFEMAAALASGDERYLKLAGLRGDVQRLERLRQAHYDNQNKMRRDRQWAESAVERRGRMADELKAAIDKRKPVVAGEFEAKIGGKTFDARDEFGGALFDAFKKKVGEQASASAVLGEIGGFKIKYEGFRGNKSFMADVHVDVPGGIDEPILSYPIEDGMAVNGLATKAANQVNGLDRRLKMAQQDVAQAERQIEQLEAHFGAPFAEEADLFDKVAQLSELETELAAESKEADSAQVAEQAQADPSDANVAYSAIPVTETPAFKKWFDDSKVVDADGKPLVVYKGMPSNDWRTGKPINVVDSANGPWAGFFSSDPGVASEFSAAFATMGDAAVFPAYLSIDRPLVIDAKGKKARDFQFDNLTVSARDQTLLDAINDPSYDGVIIRNTEDEGDVYIAKFPEQIKSATGNRGTFDPADPDIRYSVVAESGDMGTSARGMSMLEQQSPLEIRSTAAERKMSNDDLRDQVFAGLRDASGLSHPDVGSIAINRKGWSKSRANASDTAKLLTVPKLPEIIQGGAYIGSQPAGKGKTGAVAYHYIARRVNVDGVPLTALVTVEEHPDGALSYYNHSILNDNFAPTRTGPVDGLLASYRRPTFDAAGPLTREKARPAALRAVRRALMEGPLGGLIEKLIGEGHIVLHQSENSLPRSVLLKGGSAIQGIAQKGIINLVGENLTPQTAIPVLLHEVFHTKGESLIGTPKWNNLHRQLEGFYKAAQRRKAEGRVKDGDFWDAALRRVEAAERGSATSTSSVEELGAYAIENYDLAPSGIKKWVDNLIGMVKDWLYRRFGLQIGSVTPAQLRALAVAALQSASNTSPQVSKAMGGSAMGEGAMGSIEDRYFVNDVLAELAAHDEFFRYPKSAKHSIEGVFSDVMPTIKYVGVEPIIESDRADAHGAERFYRLSGDQGQQIKIYEDNDRVWLDVSELSEGQGGSGAYAAVGNYAHNTGRVFIGDPTGLSPIALRRRTEAMLASALKFGTTRHLEPHPDQLAGNKSEGVPPLRWNAGDDLGNVRSLIDVSLESLAANVPEFRNARYDFDAKAFVTSDGKPLLDSTLDGWNARRKVRASRAGRNTLKRAIFLTSLIRADVNQRPGLLEQFFNGSAQYVSPGASLNRVSYSTRERNDAVSDAIHELDGGESAEDIGGLDDASGRAIRDMRSRYMKYVAHPRHIAALFKDFVPVFKAANDQQHARNQNLEALHKDYKAYDDLPEDSKGRVNQILELGRLTGNVYRDGELKAGVQNPGYTHTVQNDEDGKPQRVRQTFDAALTKTGETVRLNAAEIDAYRHLRTMFDAALDKFRDQALREMGFAGFAPMNGEKPLVIRDADDGKIILKGMVYSDEERAALRAAGDDKEAIADILKQNPILAVIKKFDGAAWSPEHFGYVFDARQRSALERNLNEFLGKSVEGQILDMIKPGLSSGRIEMLKNMAKFVGDIEQSKRTGYVPFSRYGDYVIAVKERVADIRYTSDEESGFIARGVPDELADTLEKIGAAYDPDENAWHVSVDQRTDLERANERTVYSEKVETGLRDKFGKNAERKVKAREGRVENIPSVKEAVARIEAQYVKGHGDRRVVSFETTKKRGEGGIDMSSLDALAEIAQIDNPTWDAVRSELMKALQAGGFRKHFFQSSHVPGYTTDFQRSIADYVVGMSGYLARRQHSDDWDKAVASIKGGNLHEYATKYRAYFNDPREEFAALRQLAFVWKIGANISSAMVNLTQTFLTTIPTLNQIAGNGIVAHELAKAARDTIKMLSPKAGTNVFDMSKAPADLKEEFAKADAAGLFLPLNSFDLMGQANQRTARARKVQEIGNTATSIISLPFSASERFNRIVAFTAAARIARRKGMAARISKHFANDQWARENFGNNFSPYDFAEWLAQETQFQMGKINRPTMMRGAGAAMLQFKSFTFQMLEKMYRDWTLHGPRGKVAVFSTLAMLVAFSGLWGVPGADDLRKLLEFLHKQTTGKGINFKDELRQALFAATDNLMITDALSSGMPYHFGMDLSNRVGMGNILPEQYNKTDVDVLDTASMIGGPGFDMLVTAPIRATGLMAAGNINGAIQELAPVWAKNPMQATQWATDAVRTKRGDKVLDRSEISNADIAMKAIGVQPSRVSRQYEMSSAQYNAQRGSDDLKRGLKLRLVRALERESGNTDKTRTVDFKADVTAALDKIRDYNRTAERDQIIKLDARSLRSMMQREQMGGQSVVRRAPKASRESAIRRSEAYGIGLGK